MMLSVMLSALEAFAAANVGAAQMFTAAGSVDSAAHLGAAAAALGPIGANYLAVYAPAQANNLASTLLVAGVHAGIGEATDGSRASFVATDTERD
jgi:hypothetical protein